MALLEQIKVTHEDFQRPYGSPADVRTWNQSQEVQRSHGCQSGRLAAGRIRILGSGRLYSQWTGIRAGAAILPT
jgi:hypothetical protein